MSMPYVHARTSENDTLQRTLQRDIVLGLLMRLRESVDLHEDDIAGARKACGISPSRFGGADEHSQASPAHSRQGHLSRSRRETSALLWDRRGRQQRAAGYVDADDTYGPAADADDDATSRRRSVAAAEAEMAALEDANTPPPDMAVAISDERAGRVALEPPSRSRAARDIRDYVPLDGVLRIVWLLVAAFGWIMYAANESWNVSYSLSIATDFACATVSLVLVFLSHGVNPVAGRASAFQMGMFVTLVYFICTAIDLDLSGPKAPTFYEFYQSIGATWMVQNLNHVRIVLTAALGMVIPNMPHSIRFVDHTETLMGREGGGDSEEHLRASLLDHQTTGGASGGASANSRELVRTLLEKRWRSAMTPKPAVERTFAVRQVLPDGDDDAARNIVCEALAYACALARRARAPRAVGGRARIPRQLSVPGSSHGLCLYLTCLYSVGICFATALCRS